MTLQNFIYLTAILMVVSAYFFGFSIGEEKINRRVKTEAFKAGHKQGHKEGSEFGYSRGIMYQEVQFDILRREMTERLMDKDRIITHLRKENQMYEKMLKEVDNGTDKIEG